MQKNVTVTVSEETAKLIEDCGQDFEAVFLKGRRSYEGGLLGLPQDLIKQVLNYCEFDDCTISDDFDLIHPRLLFNAIRDWLWDHDYRQYASLEYQEFTVCEVANQFSISLNLKTILEKVAREQETTPADLLIEIVTAALQKLNKEEREYQEGQKRQEERGQKAFISAVPDIGEKAEGPEFYP